MSIELNGIVLPADLLWIDETDWTPVAQSDSEYSITGSLFVDTGVKQAGRPITLAGSEESAWVSRSTVLALMDVLAIPGKRMTLNLHGRTFTVIFNHENGDPIDATAIYPQSPPDDEGYYYLVVKLKEV